jgi:hypothetical protein
MAAFLKVNQRVELRLDLEDNVAALAPVPTGGAAPGDKLFPAESNNAIPAIASLYQNFCLVEEHLASL